MPRYFKLLIIGLGLPTVLLILFKKGFANNKSYPMIHPNPESNNLKAFLLMLQHAEGTIGANAYRMLFGGELFTDYSVHPNRVIRKSGISSTAAGAYQFLFRTWSSLKQQLALPDFSPQSQDAAAIELIRQKGALPDVLGGRISSAIVKVQKIWASLPGAGYGQRELKTEELLKFYEKAGGRLIHS